MWFYYQNPNENKSVTSSLYGRWVLQSTKTHLHCSHTDSVWAEEQQQFDIILVTLIYLICHNWCPQETGFHISINFACTLLLTLLLWVYVPLVWGLKGRFINCVPCSDASLSAVSVGLLTDGHTAIPLRQVRRCSRRLQPPPRLIDLITAVIRNTHSIYCTAVD